MRNLKLWIWPGLAVVVCLTALAIWFKAAAVETDLQSRTLAALRQDHAWAKVSLKGRDLTLTGLAPDENSQNAALDIARHVYGVRIVRDASAMLPEEKPYRLTIEKAADGIRLSGFVPNEAARTNLITTLTGMLPGIALSDQMKLARGAPTGLISLAGYGLSAFPRFSTGLLDITDRNMRISGQALNPDDHEAALAALSSVPPSAGNVSAVEITPAVKSGEYIWSASIRAGGIILNGYAPDAQTREAMLAQALSIRPELPVEDQMRFASGAPEGVSWKAATSESLSILSNLAEGTVSIHGKRLDVSGRAVGGEAFQRIQEAVSAKLTSGLVLGTADIGMAAVSPFEWTATRSGEEIVLAGYLPSEAVRAKILEASRLKFGTTEIEDNQKIAVGAPDGFVDAALAALQALSRLDDAEVRMRGGMITVKGTALTEAASVEVARLMADGLPQGFAGQPAIAFGQTTVSQLPASACQAELDRLTSLNTVLFETGEAAIQDHSYGFLDRIAHVARQCGAARLEISGHTDSDGAEAANLALSERRAKAVLDFMAAAGVATDRLTAVGYGEGRPIKSNDTDEGKAANRRIEFRVLN